MIYALYHAAHETAGLIGTIIKESGRSLREIHLYEGEGFPRLTSDVEGLIVMGGPMNVDEIDHYPFLLPEVKLIEAALAKGTPVLGICLGAQLMAKALGSRVYKNRVPELGWHPVHLTGSAKEDPVMKDLPRELTVMHWHGDTFDMPRGAVHLARSSRCENQAFSWGKNAYAFQFHFEITPAMLKGWCTHPDAAPDFKRAGEDPEIVLEKTPACFARLEPAARNVFGTYLNLACPELRPVA